MFFRDEYAFLSNFYPLGSGHTIIVPGEESDIEYPTSEHAYQAMKTTEKWKRERIALATSPANAKRLGAIVTLRPDWSDDLAIYYMKLINKEKFELNPPLLAKLKAIKEPIIEYNNWHDNFWGSCAYTTCGYSYAYNHLGKILEEIKNA